ncbi:MAG TPA: chemotaxis protein CheB [Pyrinomonadaceae bacterium]|jgi:two-component system chemotaxis response regulator CheB
MPGHDIIVVGASAGGVEALSRLARGLPHNLPASLFVVLHISAQMPSILPQILTRAGSLPAAHAVDGERIERGRIYVAPPDNHLLLEDGHMRVVHGPKENRYRPAVDPLFRSAAIAYGTRVVGVVLTGALDDGTTGMLAVKKRGGTSVIQDPREAMYSGMPQNVAQNVEVDYRLPIDEIAPLLVRLSDQPALEEGAYPVTDELRIENRIAEQEMDTEGLLKSVGELGALSSFTCPECHGTLWELRHGELLRFRCHVGHAFSAESLVVEQSQELENALWSALRSLEEKATLTRRMAKRARERRMERAADNFEAKAESAARHAEVVRQVLLNGRETDVGDNHREQL